MPVIKRLAGMARFHINPIPVRQYRHKTITIIG